MNFTNARIYRNDFEFHDGSFTVADGRFASSADGRFASSSAAGETIGDQLSSNRINLPLSLQFLVLSAG